MFWKVSKVFGRSLCPKTWPWASPLCHNPCVSFMLHWWSVVPGSRHRCSKKTSTNQISSSLKTTWIETFECQKNRKHWIYSMRKNLCPFFCTFCNIYSICFQTTKHIKTRDIEFFQYNFPGWELDAVFSPDTLLHHLHLGIWCWTLWWCSLWAVGLETRDCNVMCRLKEWLWNVVPDS